MSKRVDYLDEYLDSFDEGTELISYPQYKDLVKDFRTEKIKKPLDRKPKEKEKEE